MHADHDDVQQGFAAAVLVTALDSSERTNEAATLASVSGRGFLLDPPAASPQAAQRLEKSPCDALPDVHALGGPSRLGVVKAISAARPAAVCSALTPVSRPHKTHTLQVFFFGLFFFGEGGMGGSGGTKTLQKIMEMTKKDNKNQQSWAIR